VKLTTRQQLVSRLIMRGAIPVPPCMLSWHGERDNFTSSECIGLPYNFVSSMLEQ
jgi:hypothetical protein